MTGAATVNKDPAPPVPILDPIISCPLKSRWTNLRGEDVNKTFVIIFVTPGQEAMIKTQFVVTI